MANSRVNLTESVIKKIMEGADPRAVINQVLDEKSGYHKEKRIRDGKAEVVNVKNRKRKVHHTLTPGQRKAIKKAHSAAANKKRARSIKKGAKMGLYQGKYSRDLRFVTEADEEVQGIGITCPACGEGVLEIVDGEEDLVLVCPECNETFVICATSEIEDDDDDDDDADEQEEKDDAEQEDAEEPAEEDAEEAPAEEAAEEPAEEEDAEKAEECKKVCDGDDCDPAEVSGLFFAAE